MDTKHEYYLLPQLTTIPPLLRVGPLARCPNCGTALDGGPVLYICHICHRAVSAADVDTEYHTPRTLAA